MTTSYYADRINLYRLMQKHPDWSQQQLAQALGRSVSWVYKWQSRLREVTSGDETSLHEKALGESRARKHPPVRIDARIETLILSIRDTPPEGLRRTPGPKAILYYLPRAITLWESGLRLPTSTRTIYQILLRNGRIAKRAPTHISDEAQRPEPLSCWQIDFKDVSSVADDPVEPTGKKQHIAECFNIVDEGTSLLLWSCVRTDFRAETLLESLAEAIAFYGVPACITLDRDPRAVGAPLGSDFPSALLRFGMSLGIEMRVCPPRHPQMNGFVERYHRTYQQECLTPQRPGSLEEAREVTAAFLQHYNHQRPHQGRSCGNRPPRTAFPLLPTLPRPPERVEVDGWLRQLDGWHVERKIDTHGRVHLDLRSYYVSASLVGQRVTLSIDAASQSLVVWQGASKIRELPLKGLCGASYSFSRFVDYMRGQARALHRLRSLQERAKRRT